MGDLPDPGLARATGGTLVPAATIVELLRKAMERRGWEGGRYLIDGFPRNVENFEAWQTTLGERVNLKCVLLLQVSEEVTLQRRLRQAPASGRHGTGGRPNEAPEFGQSWARLGQSFGPSQQHDIILPDLG